MRIQPENVDDIRRRFYSFYDGVVRAVRLNISSKPRTCEVDIEAKDMESPSGWSSICLTLLDVSAFRFELGRTTFEVLSGGIQFGWRDGAICVVLDAYPDDGEELPDLRTNIAYVIGLSCDVNATAIEPLPKS